MRGRACPSAAACATFCLGKGGQAEAKAPSLARRGLSDGVLPTMCFCPERGIEGGGERSRQRAGEAVHRRPPVRPFALGKGEQEEAKAPSLAQRGTIRRCSSGCAIVLGRERGRGVHLFAPGRRPIHRCFFRAMALWWAERGRWPAGCFLLVGGKRREWSPSALSRLLF